LIDRVSYERLAQDVDKGDRFCADNRRS